jgi:pimeloyl-ACP methyl ester carboxylesterase
VALIEKPDTPMMSLSLSPGRKALNPKACVIALHCSLGSGRQWSKLVEQLGPGHDVIAPDIAGYGDNRAGLELPVTLTEEIAALCGIDRAAGPVHLVGHSYGGAIAFKMATASPFADRVRSLTLIEPVLPTLLDAGDADREQFARLAREVSADLWNRQPARAIDRFLTFWSGSAPPEELPPDAKLRLAERVEKVAFDFTAAFDELTVAAAAACIRVPTLLISGGLSPRLTQRIVERLAAIIPDAETRHVVTAGHMLPITHARLVNPEITAHIARADANVPAAGGFAAAAASELDPAAD